MPARMPPDQQGLRFCMVTTFYPPYHFGGDGVAVQRLTHALARRGHRIEVIHDLDAFRMQHRGAWPEPGVEPPGVRVHRLRSRLGRLSPLLTHQFGRPVVHGRRIRRILRQGRFDVIHFHNVSLVGGPGVLSYGSAIKLYTAHEHWLVCPTHVLWRHNRDLCSKRECLRCVLRHRRPPQLWRWTGLLERKATEVDAFIAPSTFTAAKHQEFGFPSQFDTLPGFLSNDSAVGRSIHPCLESNTRPYFLYVGRLEQIKGVQELLPHFTGREGPELVVAGSGGDEDRLRALAASHPRIRFVGRKSEAELQGLYRDALGLLVPSLCYETFGLVVLEAFREGTPVIARNRGPLAEIVTESGGGLLFESAADLGGAIHRLAADSALRDRLGAAGFRAWQTRWTEDLVMERYFAIIRRLALRKGLGHVLERLGPNARDGHAGERRTHGPTRAGADVPLARSERVGHLDAA